VLVFRHLFSRMNKCDWTFVDITRVTWFALVGLRIVTDENTVSARVNRKNHGKYQI
jgi:hypothetical protein